MPPLPSPQSCRRAIYAGLALGLLLAAVSLLAGCDKTREPIPIGFLGGLTGRVADLGIAGRDGVILAVEEQNRAGGIAGRPIELLIADDRQDPEVARGAVDHLIDQGVWAIIGPMTSSMAMATVPAVNRHRVPMLSPTASTNELIGIDDSFFRTYPASARAADRLAEHLAEDLGLRRVNAIFDLGNRAHTESWLRHFQDAFAARGGRIEVIVPYLSSTQAGFMALAKELLAGDPQALFILANALDTALLMQQLNKLENDLPVFASEWSATEDILEYGGKTVDGLRFFHTFDRGHPAPQYQRFRQAFQDRFGYEAGFASTHAFDAARILFQALARSSDRQTLRRNLTRIGTFQGLQGEIHLDPFGDAARRHFLMTIRDGAFLALPREPQ